MARQWSRVLAQTVPFSRANTLSSQMNNSRHVLTRICELQGHVQRACAQGTDQTCGLCRFRQQVVSTPGPQRRPTAQNSEPRGTPPHTMHSMRTLAAATACLGTTIDRRASHRRTAPCRHNLRAAHRHAAPSGPSVLPCGAVDRWAERDAEELVHTWSPRMFQSHAITSAIMSAWTSPGTLPLEDLLTSRSNGSTSVRTQQQK